MKSAFVTGATGGIGSEVARALAARGYGLTLVARDEAALERLAATIGSTDAIVQTCSADLNEDDHIRRAVQVHGACFPGMDALVNCAGAASPHVGALTPTEDLDALWRLNLRAPMILFREALEQLQLAAAAREKAKMILLGSLLGAYPTSWLAAYSALKAGVSAFGQALNSLYARDGIQTTVISPATVDTPMAHEVRLDPSTLIPARDIADLVCTIIELSGGAYVSEAPVLRRGSKLISPI